MADPLLPGAGWEIGTNPTEAQETSVYQSLDPGTGKISNMPIRDVLVDNVNHNPKGRQSAHDYRDNKEDFIKSVAGDILEPLMEKLEQEVALSTTRS